MLSYKLNDGNTVPWVAFGTGTSLRKQDASAAVTTALANNVTHIDTASVYDNEASVGAAIKASGIARSSLFITTKFIDLPGGEGETIRDALTASLTKLGLAYVDLFLIHDPSPTSGKPGMMKAWWKEMEALKNEGLTRSIGVSNFTVEYLKEVLDGATVVPAVNQIEFHLHVYDTAKPLYEFCKEHGILVAAYSGLTPLVHVKDASTLAIIDKVIARVENQNQNQNQNQGSGSGRAIRILREQVLFKYLLQKGVLVVTTTSKPERIADILAVPGADFELSEAEMEQLETAGGKVHFRVFMGNVFGEKSLYNGE